MTAPVRFATVGVLQNGLNVAVFARRALREHELLAGES